MFSGKSRRTLVMLKVLTRYQVMPSGRKDLNLQNSTFPRGVCGPSRRVFSTRLPALAINRQAFQVFKRQRNSPSRTAGAGPRPYTGSKGRVPVVSVKVLSGFFKRLQGGGGRRANKHLPGWPLFRRLDPIPPRPLSPNRGWMTLVRL